MRAQVESRVATALQMGRDHTMLSRDCPPHASCTCRVCRLTFVRVWCQAT